jgi:hypothetical protein
MGPFRKPWLTASGTTCSRRACDSASPQSFDIMPENRQTPYQLDRCMLVADLIEVTFIDEPTVLRACRRPARRLARHPLCLPPPCVASGALAGRRCSLRWRRYSPGQLPEIRQAANPGGVASAFAKKTTLRTLDFGRIAKRNTRCVRLANPNGSVTQTQRSKK